MVLPIANMDKAVQAVGSVGLAAILARLNDTEQHDIRDALARSLQRYVKDGFVHLPSAANVASATK